MVRKIYIRSDIYWVITYLQIHGVRNDLISKAFVEFPRGAPREKTIKKNELSFSLKLKLGKKRVSQACLQIPNRPLCVDCGMIGQGAQRCLHSSTQYV